MISCRAVMSWPCANYFKKGQEQIKWSVPWSPHGLSLYSFPLFLFFKSTCLRSEGLQATKRDFLQQLAWREDLLFSCQIYLCPAVPRRSLRTLLVGLFMAAVNSQRSGKKLQQQVNVRDAPENHIPDPIQHLVHELTGMKNGAGYSHQG